MPRIAFLDFEASGLDDDHSYPIEVGFALSTGGPAQARLIRPQPDWTYWDPNAEAMHGLSREFLFTEGAPATDFVAWLRAHLSDIPIQVGAAEDVLWFRRLIRAADSDWAPRLDDAEALIQATAFRGYKNLADLRREMCRRYGAPHRAGPDAARLRDLYRAACRR